MSLCRVDQMDITLAFKCRKCGWQFEEDYHSESDAQWAWDYHTEYNTARQVEDR